MLCALGIPSRPCVGCTEADQGTHCTTLRRALRDPETAEVPREPVSGTAYCYVQPAGVAKKDRSSRECANMLEIMVVKRIWSNTSREAPSGKLSASCR